MTGKGESTKTFPIWKTELLPQEEMLELGKKKKKLVIGIPRENQDIESRVALTPEAVELLVANDHEVYIEDGAGLGSNYTNTDYSERGGQILDTAKEVFQCDLILKITPPTLDEISLMKGNQSLFSSLMFTGDMKKCIRSLIEKKVSAFAFEKIQDENNCFPVVRSMSDISGKTAVLVAAEYLSLGKEGKGVLLGGLTGITPTEVVILGAGYAAESAVKAALGLGASVKVFDSSIPKLRHLEEKVGSNLYTSIYHPRVLEKAVKSTEVLISAVHFKDNTPSCIVTGEMVKEMKKGTVIVDISIDQGISIETSEPRTQQDPVFTKHGIIHYCVPNLPSRVARTASISLSNIFAPLLLEMGGSGGVTPYLKEFKGMRKGIYIYNGILTSRQLGDYLDLPFKDIDLLMAAF